jgi:hypothetical protein
MKQKDYMMLGIIIFISALFSIILAGKIFGGISKKHNLTAPDVKTISSDFPDMKNDPSYNTVFNGGALNPTQLIQIGTSQNSSTFNSGQ